MQTMNEIRKKIASIKPQITDKYRVKNLFIFGSYATGEQNERSDLDLLVEFHETPDLLTFLEMEEFLSQRLQIPVDLVPKRKLKPRLRDSIRQEAIII